MSGERNSVLLKKLGRLGPSSQAALVCGVVTALWLLAAPVAYNRTGLDGLFAAAIAGGITMLGATLALVLNSVFRTPATAMHAMALSMLARTMLPLGLGVVLHFNVPALATAGMIYYLLVFYLAALALDTTLSLAHLAGNSGSNKTA